jgi:CPA1 family monovalent cation:H+ antiporter
MRGVVTLAAAQTLPVGTPQRALLILIAFTVAAGSMLLQGGTLGWVARRLDLVGHDAAPEGEQTALDQTLGEAALKALAQPNLRRPNGEPYDPHVIALLKLRLMVTQLHDSTWGEAAEPGTDTSMADTTTTKVAANDPVPDAPADQADVAEPATSVPEASPAEAGVPTATVTAAPDSTPDPARTPFAAAAAAVWSQASEELIGGEADDESTLDTVEHKRQYSELRLVSLRAKREALLEARALGTYSYRTLSAAMAVLDADEISLELRTRTHE